MAEKKFSFNLDVKSKDLIIAITLLVGLIYTTSVFPHVFHSNTRVIILAVVFLGTIILFSKYLKSSNALHPLALAVICTVVVAITMYQKDLEKQFKNVFHFDLNKVFNDIFHLFDQPDDKTNEKIKKTIYEKYADPTKNEVYFPGSDNVKMHANAAGVSLTGLFLLPKNYVCVVFTNQIIGIQDHEDTADETWNKIYHGHMYPLYVNLDDNSYVVYCHCLIKEVDTTFFDTVKCPDGNTYHICHEYRHMNKNDAMYIYNHAPFLSIGI